MGKVIAVCTSEKKGTEKRNVNEGNFIVDFGLEGDAHAGKWHRQVSLLSLEKFNAFNAKIEKEEEKVIPGAFGENLLVEGIPFASLPIGTEFQCNDVILRLTQIGKECHSHCEIFHRVGECIMPKQGVFTEVVKGGRIKVGDTMSILRNGYRAAVITLSDSGFYEGKKDISGTVLENELKSQGYEITNKIILPDEKERLKEEYIRICDENQADIIFTTGGTGLSPRDQTPEATLEIAERNLPGIAEAIRANSMLITNRAMFSRGVAVTRGKTLIINLPGSPKAVKECLDFVLPELWHALGILLEKENNCAGVKRN